MDMKKGLFLLLAFAFLFVVSLFQDGSYSGEASKSLRDKACNEIGDDDVLITVGGQEQLYESRCVDGGARVLKNYCNGVDRRFYTEWCSPGEECSAGQCREERDLGRSREQYGLVQT